MELVETSQSKENTVISKSDRNIQIFLCPFFMNNSSKKVISESDWKKWVYSLLNTTYY